MKHTRTDEFEKATDSFLLSRIIFKKFQTKKERTLITLIASTLRESVVEKSNARASRRIPFVATVPNRARERAFFLYRRDFRSSFGSPLIESEGKEFDFLKIHSWGNVLLGSVGVRSKRDGRSMRLFFFFFFFLGVQE